MTDVNNLDDITKQSNRNNNNTNNNDKNQLKTESKQIVLGCDSNGYDDENYQNTVKGILEQAGYTVEKLTVYSNAYAEYSYKSDAKGKIGIYLIAAGTFSIGDGKKNLFDYNYFGIRPECSPDWDVDDFDTKPIGADADSRGGVNDDIKGHSFKEINEIVKDRCMCVTGKDAEEMGKNLVAALGGQVQGGSTQTVAGATAVSIPDKTFYGLIKQIIGAVDGLFIIANNMAYLLSFKDMYEYRNQYDEYIPKIEQKHVLNDTMQKNWTTQSFYNAVEVTYDGGIIKYQNDDLVKQYGENVYYYNFPSDDEETAKAKADALLAAHIRDYSTHVQLSIFYDSNITTGSWVKVNKSITQISGKTLSETLQDTNKKVSTKRKGLTIENLTEKTINDKTFQSVTDEKGDTYDIEVENSDYELFFVQGYTCRWDKNNSLIMDLDLKYGPDTPEDPINATIGVGGTNNQSGAVAAGGQWGNDCFNIFDLCIQNNDFLMDSYSGGARVEEMKTKVNGEWTITSEDTQGRANQNSNYAKKYSGLSAAEVYTNFRNEYDYSLYCDSSSCFQCASDFYDNAGKTANCGDTACLLKVFFDSAGVPCIGLHIHGHYFNAIQINGTWEIIDGVRIDNQTCGFPDGSGYSSGNPCPCDSYPGGGYCVPSC